jgi:hypothetical protein
MGAANIHKPRALKRLWGVMNGIATALTVQVSADVATYFAGRQKHKSKASFLCREPDRTKASREASESQAQNFAQGLMQ